jgi:hypothetical protein
MLTYFTTEDYFGPWLGHADLTLEVHQAAEDLLRRVNLVCEICDMAGVDFPLNPKTKSYVSGEKYGGFRPQEAKVGAPGSAHKTGQAVDIYDPHHEIAVWFQKHPAILKEHGLAMEHPDATPVWCHLTSRLPKSGKTVFRP